MKTFPIFRALTLILVILCSVLLTVTYGADTYILDAHSCSQFGADTNLNTLVPVILGSDTVILSVPRISKNDPLYGIVTVVSAVLLIALRLLLPIRMERNNKK